MAAAVTFSVGGLSYAALNTNVPVQKARSVSAAADCRTVDTAIAAYLAQNDVAPTTVAEIQPYVLGDISAYRIVRGLAAGPGCPE
jgi:hypothetical protein